MADIVKRLRSSQERPSLYGPAARVIESLRGSVLIWINRANYIATPNDEEGIADYWKRIDEEISKKKINEIP